MTIAEHLTKDERSALVYAESCAVDRGGLLEAKRMNGADHVALCKFQQAGLLTWGRIPSCCLPAPSHFSSSPTHWVRLTEEGWVLAGELRRLRSHQLGPYSTAVFAVVDEDADKKQQVEKLKP